MEGLENVRQRDLMEIEALKDEIDHLHNKAEQDFT